jgi:hypothetical protein
VAAPISTEEFHTLNLCLDNAIVGSVTEYSRLRDLSMAEAATERSGVFAHELRNRISAARLGFDLIKSGHAPIGGSVATVVTRNLHGISTLINRALVEVRVDSGESIGPRSRALHQPQGGRSERRNDSRAGRPRKRVRLHDQSAPVARVVVASAALR